ncbi:MAG: LysM peptidoglycan-binding domain-containing protein [Candidatus Aureabacteria bacterium]|nr:LysM peptidoglycan-binding domain-containing protein [Candidatus Auribacterota bacterium]
MKRRGNVFLIVVISALLVSGCTFNKKYKKVNVPVYRFGEEAGRVEEKQDLEKKVYVEGVREYRVKPGDTLSKISRSFNVSVDDLAEFNHIKDSNSIQVGMILQIPPASMQQIPYQPISKDENVITHKVERGETLWGISRLYGVEVEVLKEVNDLESPALTEGQVIYIPLK